MGYRYDSATRTFYPEASSNEATEVHGGVVWTVRYVVTCGRNHPDRPEDDVLCVDALCEAGDSMGYDTLVFRRQSVEDTWEPWPGRERICRVSTVGDPIPLADFEAEITTIIEEHYENIARPEIDVAPAVNAVVNLPVLAATPDPGAVGFDIENPLPGTVDAVPSFGWQWSNGEAGSGPGRGYDGTDPVATPDHYPVRAVFTVAGEGRVELTATWTITLTVEGIPPITDIEPLVYEASEGFTVRSARTVLVD
ncbi:hypothetical protein [Phytoactinopolyspora mesophila]|uniref:Uncharacterized protein n=1 Tax=Phytoactinopolyspora mesophila TaxID=2650750 RepID=A0A7K3MCN9_9ACTN|nr:hypothetical protein [Phytoactinopolyspora mesophila]NDL60158.1 hypothetical protein [Phytoactinopolyspora mesophila]